MVTRSKVISRRLTLPDAARMFDVTVLEARDASRFVLFAAGGGGNPERHIPLLSFLAEHSCTVVAPHFDRLLSPSVTDEDFLLRARRSRLALDVVAGRECKVAGVGHSLGATTLLALAGGEVWMRHGEKLTMESEKRLDRLALLAPATGFFQAPGALDAMRIPILAWVGSHDTLTPPAHAEYLERTLGTRTSVKVRVVPEAGHFSFMNRPPPHAIETLPDREAFLDELAANVCRFVTS